MELIGLTVSISGIIIMLHEPDAKRIDGEQHDFGKYLVCLASTLAGSFFLLIIGLLVKEVPTCTLLFSQSMLAFLYNALLLRMIYGSDYEFFSINPDQGAFGIFSQDMDATIAFVLSAGFWGSAEYILGPLFFSPVILSSVILLEPFLAQLIGYGLEIDQMPGWMTWIGTIMVILGILAI